MKFSTFTSTFIGAALVFASKALADVDYFDWPSPNAVFRTGTSIQFVVDDMPDGDDDERVYANLYRENGSFVKTIRSWDSDRVDDDDEFAFTWYVDRNLKSGRYFVEIFADDDDDDDISRSFIFDITSGAPTTTPTRYPAANNNRFQRPAMRNTRKVYRPARGGARSARGPKRMGKNRYHKREAVKSDQQ